MMIYTQNTFFLNNTYFKNYFNDSIDFTGTVRLKKSHKYYNISISYFGTKLLFHKFVINLYKNNDSYLDLDIFYLYNNLSINKQKIHFLKINCFY